MEEISRNSIYYSTNNIAQKSEFDSSSLIDEELFIEKDETINFVLVYKDSDNLDDYKKRKYFEDHLRDIGLILTKDQHDHLNFVAIHVPQDVLCRYCEIMKLRMQLKRIPGLNVQVMHSKNVMKIAVKNISNFIDNKFETKFLEDEYKWTAEFSVEKDYLFNMNSKNFFSPADKCVIINFILERGKFGDNPQDIGMGKLISEDVYDAAYPLHDGNLDTPDCQRSFFLQEWASLKKIFKFQPLDDIKNYFGVKFALYFAWLGFYTAMLIPAAIFGIICMLYGFITLPSDSISNDICNTTSEIIMCPQCDKICDYWRISDACTYAKITHLFDNFGTVAYGLCMSIWSAIYLEMWKRYSAEISHRWGLTGFDLDAQHPRPEYLTRLAGNKMKINVVTNQEEPVVPFCRVKLPIMVLSFSFAILWVFLAVAAVFGVVIYRMTGIATDIIFDKSNSFTSFVVPITAGIINLVCITILNFLYEHLAFFLTKTELQRTQVEFDDSLTLKIYMFQFVNFYSSLFYIAFLKGKFIGYPKQYNRVLGFRQEECSLGGCMMELFIQLAIIMIGKQTLNAFMEIGIPKLKSLLKKSSKSKDEIVSLEMKDGKINSKQWIDDYNLMSWDSKGMFSEYLEMVIQYGFLTIFVTAFPLAPLFALINNIFEMRLDAKKYLIYYRRPRAHRVKDIGMWFHIIEALGRISIITNAFIIAFSSNYIPLMVYISQNPTHTEEGYLNNSLSYFNVQDFENGSLPIDSKFVNISQCRYSDYRDETYETTPDYWHVLAARLAFIVVYQNVVAGVVMVVQWAVPDVPKKLKDQIKREVLRTSDYIIEQEAAKAKAKRSVTPRSLSSNK